MSLQPISFVDADPVRVQEELLTAYQMETGQILYPGDPRRIFLMQLVPAIVALKNGINYGGNQNLLPFASGQMLDALGERIGAVRLEAQRARVTVRFTLAAVLAEPVVVPRGTRVTSDGVLYFAVSEDTVILPGQLSGETPAVAAEGGEQYNGLVPGQIRILVDPIPYVSGVTNVDTSDGGSDAESDEAYRERQRRAPAGFSVAGPEDGYVYYAKSADVSIADVAVLSPGAGVVNIYPLMKGGQVPGDEMLEKVLAEVSPKHRRPLTDQVNVVAPTPVPYDIDFTYYISKERLSEESAIRAAIESAGGAVDQFVAWQSSKLGRAVTPDELLSRLYAAGAYRVVLGSPTFDEISPYEFGECGLKNIVYGGLI